jgi:hypothetical protein
MCRDIVNYLSILILILIYLLIAIGLTPGGSSTVHIHTQTVHRTRQLKTLVGKLSGIRTQSGQTKINDERRKNYRLIGKSAGRAPSLRVIPLHLPYNRGKSTEKPQSGWFFF